MKIVGISPWLVLMEASYVVAAEAAPQAAHHAIGVAPVLLHHRTQFFEVAAEVEAAVAFTKSKARSDERPGSGSEERVVGAIGVAWTPSTVTEEGSERATERPHPHSFVSRKGSRAPLMVQCARRSRRAVEGPASANSFPSRGLNG